MGWDFRGEVIKQAGLLIGLVLLLGVSVCFGLIKIEPAPIPTPTPTKPLPTPITDIPLSGGGAPSRIAAETIVLDAPVVEMGWQLEEQREQAVNVWVVPNNEAGWHRNSAQLGQGSNVVISGHNNSTGGHVFGNVEELELGDRITLWDNQGSAYVYQVTERQIVQTFAASQETLNYLQAVAKPTANEQLTLITCWPNWTNTHRLIVIARPL